MSSLRLSVPILGLLALASCGGGGSSDKVQPTATQFNDSGPILPAPGPRATKREEAGSTIAVNTYLWRGALETLGFMPMTSVDPYGGVIVTDWYSPPTTQGERFKATAYILGRQLRADGIKVTIFRQVLQGGQWTDAPPAPQTAAEIEDKILVRARELRAESKPSG